MITSLIEALELPDFGHMTTSTINLIYEKKMVGDVIDKHYDVITIFPKYFYFEILLFCHFCLHH